MDAIFMNSKNNGIFNLCTLLLNLLDKTNLKRSDKYVALSNLSIYYIWKIIKKSYKNNRFKISARTWKMNLNYMMDFILNQTFKIILNKT